MEGGGFVVGEARVRLRPSTSTFAAEAAAGIDPALTGIEGRIAGSSGRIHATMLGLSRNLGGFGVPIVGALGSVNTALVSSDQRAGGFATTLSRLGRVEAIAAGAGIAILATQLNEFVAQGRDADRVGRLTDAVLKSTGGTAHLTADEVAHLADEMSRKAGIDDEIIQSGENVMLTFTRVRNEVGAGNDIFSQATQAALDMSAAMHQELQPSIVQIGKALQDPIVGVTALQRVGVRLTEQQKEQVKAFVESGDIMSAQKVILRELEVEFGGAAEANADWFDKLGVAAENLQERIGQALIPQIIRAGDVTGAIFGRLQDANRATDGWAGKTLELGAAIPIAVFAGEKLWGVGGKIVDQYGKVIDRLGGVVSSTRATAAAEELLVASTTASSVSSQVAVATSVERAGAEDIVAASISTRVAAQEAATVADVAKVGGDTAVVGATQIRVAAEGALVDAEAALLRAQAFNVNASVAQGSANAALAAVQAELSGSFEITDAALTRLNVTHARATAASLAAASAAQVEATAEAQLAAATAVATAAKKAEAGAQLGVGEGAFGAGIPRPPIGLGVLAGMTAAVAVGVGLAVVLRSIGHSAYLSDGEVKQLNADLLKGGEDGERAAAAVAKQYGGEAAAGIKRYSDLILAGADAKTLDAQQSKVLDAALHEVTESFDLNATQTERALKGTLDMGEGSKSLQFRLTATRQAIDKQIDGLEKLNEKYGASAVQNAELSLAQKRYADLLAGGTASERDLAVARDAVVASAGKTAIVQDKVNAATAEGQSKTDAAATAVDKYDLALKAFVADASSGHARIGQLSSAWSAVTAVADNSGATQRQLTGILNATGLAAAAAAGDVISLAMAEAALGNFSANAVSSAKNLSDAAFQQYDAQTKVQSSTEAYQSAVDALSESQDGGGGGGGAAGATQTATAMMIDQTSKALALTDALRAQEQTARQIAEAQETLTEARADADEATDEVIAAETRLERVLRGVSAASRQAQDATEDLQRARLDSRSRALDEAGAERDLDEARQLQKDNAVTSADSIKAAEEALRDARLSHDPTVIAESEQALKDARTAAAELAVEDDEKVQRAEIRLAESKLATADATDAQNEAQRIYHGTLHGFPPASEEARVAQDDLTAAQDRARDAADAVTSAQQSLSDAQYQTEASALAVKRAQADVRGELESIPAAAGGAVRAYDNVQSKMLQVRAAAKQLAEDTRDAVTQSTGSVAEGILAQITMLRDLTAANPLLKGAFDQVLENLTTQLKALGFLGPQPPAGPLGPPLPSGTDGFRVPGTSIIRRAGGGDIGPDVWSWVGEEGPELAKGLTGGGARIYSHPESVAMTGLSAQPRVEIAPAPMQSDTTMSSGTPMSTAREIGAEIARAIAPYIKAGVHVQGTFVALDPEELAAESARQLAGQIASTGQGVPI